MHKDKEIVSKENKLLPKTLSEEVKPKEIHQTEQIKMEPISQLASTFQQDCDKKIRIRRLNSNAERQRRYRIRKKLKLLALAEQNREKNCHQIDNTKQEISNNILINSITNIERVSCKMSVSETKREKITEVNENANYEHKVFNTSFKNRFSSATVQDINTMQKKFKKFNTNAEKQRAYRERKKLKLEALSKQNKSTTVLIKQGIEEKCLINQQPMTSVEKISSEMSYPEENNILLHEIKTEPRVNEESTKESIFQENCSAEISYQFTGIKQEITEDVNDTEKSFFQGNSVSVDEVKQEPNKVASEDNIFNYTLTDHFQLLADQETFQESTTNYRRKRMTNAEKQKAYRERKKWRLETFSNQNKNVIQSDKKEEELSAHVDEANISNLNLTKEFASTDFQEVCVENSSTQKINCDESMFSFVDINTILSKNLDENSQGKRKSSNKWKSNAEKQKAYRERKKMKCQTLSKTDYL